MTMPCNPISTKMWREVGHSGEQFDIVHLYASIVCFAGSNNSATSRPKGFEIDGVGSPNLNRVAGLNEVSAQALEIRFGTAECWRVPLNEMGDTKRHSPSESGERKIRTENAAIEFRRREPLYFVAEVRPFFSLAPALRGEGWGEGFLGAPWARSTPSTVPSPSQSWGRGQEMMRL